jgi:peptide/nickel transport system permease protein
MLTYVVRRLLWLPVILLAVSLVTFTLGFYGPGDPALIRLGGRAGSPEQVERIRHQLGLDRPFLVQYGDYVWSAMQGDMGESLTKFPGQKVSILIADKIWISVQLGLAAMLITVAVGIPLGHLAAVKQGTWLDTIIMSTALIFTSIPVFVSAPFLLLFLAVKLDLLPVSGWGGFFDQRIVMPALALGVPGIGVMARYMRTSTLEVLHQDFVRTARAKGLTELVVQSRHVMRNALIPVVTIIGLSMATLVEGAFITETFFGIPGIGRLAVDSIFARDYPIIMALGLIIAIAFVVANLVVDLVYALLDPRIRYQ